MNVKLRDAAGRAYGLPEAEFEEFVRAGPGTPGGELLRRYWQPIALSSDATELPKAIRRFGEELILFRNKSGEPGLLYPRCIHRGTSLLFGRVEEDGIRCCYHGWKFDNQGQCLDQPCEPQGGVNKQRYRQPWYPVVEKHGAIWTYMGPPEKQPLFPIYSVFENLGDDEDVGALDFAEGEYFSRDPYDYNWFQAWDNVTDTYHVPWLHTLHSGTQFAGMADQLITGVMPKVAEWKVSDEGNAVIAVTKGAFDNSGDLWCRFEEALLPNFMALPTTNLMESQADHKDGHCFVLTFWIPCDDTSHWQVWFVRKKKDQHAREPLAALFAIVDSTNPATESDPNRKRWRDKTPEERQRFPADYDCQRGQGAITLHSEENLVNSDRGVALQRRLFRQQCEIVANGGDPIGVAFREEDRRIPIHAKSWFEKARDPETV